MSLPEGWSEAFDPNRQRKFFINAESGHAQWEPPLYPASELPTSKLVEQPVVAMGLPVASAAGEDISSRNAVATHITPSQDRRAGWLCVAVGGPSVPAPAARALAAGERWCVLEAGELFVLPASTSPASDVQLKLGLVGVRGVTCASELQAGAPHALFLELSPEERSRDGWVGLSSFPLLVLVAKSEQEQQEWQTCLQRVATAYRNWRRLEEAPGAVVGGLKSVGRFAMHAAGSGLGWQVGRDAGSAVSRAVGLRK